MNINIITFNLAPMEAYTDSDTAYKRYQTLKEDKCVIGSYGIISLPILDASKPAVSHDKGKPGDTVTQAYSGENICPVCGYDLICPSPIGNGPALCVECAGMPDLLEWPCQQLFGGTGSAIRMSVNGMCTHPECHPKNNDRNLKEDKTA